INLDKNFPPGGSIRKLSVTAQAYEYQGGLRVATGASPLYTSNILQGVLMRLPIAFLLVCWSLPAQTVSTQILGLVTDASGAIVPGATVTAKRVETGDVRTTTSNETGNYAFSLLETGEYEITCSAAGFKTEVRRGVTLELQQKARLDFQLQVGQQTEM